MTEQTQLANRQEVGMTRIKNYILSPEVKLRFSDMMGLQGIYYLNQVMITVANSEALQKCTPQSILISAMRAASLQLSVDPTSGQAWIIPYGGQAQFQIGYKGVYELAQRTGLYRFINPDIDIYDGEEVTENRMTGIHTISGKRKPSPEGDRVIGRMLYFELIDGFKKTFYMTVEEIAHHGEHYSKSYHSQKSPWNDPEERPKMERKTVLINGLRRYGRFNPAYLEIINDIEEGKDLDAGFPDESRVTILPPETHTEAENLKDLGYETESEIVKAPISTVNPEVNPEPVEQTKPWASEKISWETATKEQDSKKKLYWDMPIGELLFHKNGYVKQLAANGLTQELREDKQMRLDIILAIIDYKS
jgi:recombination protein RecT